MLLFAAYTLNNIAVKYNFKISVNKINAIAMKGKMNARTKIVINNNTIEQVNIFNYLGYTITLSNNRDLGIERNRFNQICSTIRRTLNNKTREESNI
jgi:hypothetical protein